MFDTTTETETKVVYRIREILNGSQVVSTYGSWDNHFDAFKALERAETELSLGEDWKRSVIKVTTTTVTTRETEELTPCEYTFSHTRHWCGHSQCRDA